MTEPTTDSAEAKEAQQQIEEYLGDMDAELCEELQACTYTDESFGTCIKHPLVFSIMHLPQMNDVMNKSLEKKKEARDRAYDEENWHSYVFLHERAYRLNAFANIADKMDPASYWEVLGGIWTDSENVWENEQEWEEFLSSETPERSRLMEDEEREALAKLPETLTIHRGYTLPHRKLGMSWTLERERAEWFARRFQRDEAAQVVTATVKKADVLAHFTGRGEAEIVVFPDKLTVQTNQVVE